MSLKLRWYLARLKRMSPPEVLWRARQSVRAKMDARRHIDNSLSKQATEFRSKLNPINQPRTISYFDRRISWNAEPIPWQGHNGTSLAKVHWSRINYRDVMEFGDPKVTWELNRHQFLKRWKNGDTSSFEYANAVSHLILDWIANNPVDCGINWCSSLELGLRLISWQQALETVDSDNFQPETLNIINESVRQHSRHLRRFPSLYSSANNHRIGELTGELAAAVIAPEDRQLLMAAYKAWQQLQKEAHLQVASDGVDREQAFYYHAYVLLYFQRSLAYARKLSLAVPEWFVELMGKMQNMLNAATDDKGVWFEIGDRDDGDLKALQLDESQPIAAAAGAGNHAFPEGGYFIWKNVDEHALFRCGKFGYPSIAAHAHCDQLSVLLKIRNNEIFTDSGTCSYHDNEKWRRYFRGSTAHNTVRIDGLNQAEYGGPFLWNTAPSGKIIESTAENAIGEIRLRGREESSALHRRNIGFKLESDVILRVNDQVTSEQSHKVDLIWNFGPDVRLVPGSSGNDKHTEFSYTITLKDTPLAEMTIISNTLATPSIYFGNEKFPAGFFSRKFGERIPIQQLRITCDTPNWDVATTITRLDQH